MNIWLFKHGETLPGQEGVRKMRTWTLAEALVARGHDVTWWTSTFSHQRKTFLARSDADVAVGPRFRVRMIHAGQYRRNVSLARLVHHMRLGRGFRKTAGSYPKPDVIVCAYPVIELAKEVADYAKAHRIPLIVDVRDQWPTTFLLVCPVWLKPLMRIYVNHLLRAAKEIFLAATRIVAMSQGCLKWAHEVGAINTKDDRVFHLGFIPRGDEDAPESRVVEEISARVRGKLAFVYAGSLGAFYELPLVIEAARRCRRDGLTDVHFILAGDGERLAELQRLAEGLDNISFTGWLESRDLHRVLKLAQVGLLPYRDFGEGTLPNKPAEYFAYGLPVISSIEGEFAELVDGHSLGINYLPGDLDGLCAAIKTVRNDVERRKGWSANATRAFSEHFDAREIYRLYADYVAEVAERFAPGHARSAS